MYNNELQNIDTPEKAYLLGLFYSDGCIFHNKSYSAFIVLDKKDKYLLEKLKTIFPFFSINRHSENSFALVCSRKKLVEDLIRHGMYYRKSTENRFNLKLPKLSSNLISHFIRGYFDGDGSVYKQKLGNTKFSIGGACYYLITDIIKVLYDNKITVNITCKYAKENLRSIDYYELYCSSDKVSKNFANYIYQNCGDLYIIRKYEKLNFIPEYHRLERHICPICGGTNTVRGGTRQNKHGIVYRSRCKDCNKQFSVTAPLNSNI